MRTLATRVPIVALLVAALTLVVVPSALAVTAGPSATDDVTLAGLVNQTRRDAGLPALSTNLQLTRLARTHAQAMAAADDAGGSCGDGRTLHHRARLDAGVTEPWTALRENVGCSSGGVSGLHQAFLASPGHRANVLAVDVTQIGVGTWRSAGGTLWVTQLFMRGGQPASFEIVNEGIGASRVSYPDGTRPPFVVVARADVYADALGGAALAGRDAPILFTDGPTAVEPDPVVRPRTRAELDRLLGGSGHVYLLGGVSAVSARAERELRAGGYRVTRLAGNDRTATAVAIAEQVVSRHGTPARIAVANAGSWADAVTAGAASGRHGDPVVLVGRDTIPATTRRFLDRFPNAERVALGGSGVISDAVVTQLGARRVAGPSRAETALAVADEFFDDDLHTVVLGAGYTATAWGQTLAWSPYAAAHDAPQLLVGDDLPPSVATWLTEHRGELRPRFTSGLSPELRREVEALLQ